MRSYYNASHVPVKQRGPSLTPPKVQMSSLSKERITKPIKENKPFTNNCKKVDNINLNLAIQNTSLFLQQQNAILSARKATLNLNESSEKLRRTSPLEKSPISTRLATIQKSKQISASQSQQAISQVLASMRDPILEQHNQLKHISEIDSNQKTALDSREFTNNSSKHRTEDVLKLQKECSYLQKRVIELEQKNSVLERFNQQILSIVKSCECNRIKIHDLQTAIRGTSLSMHTVPDETELSLQDKLFTDSSRSKIKRTSTVHESSEIKPKQLFNQTIAMDVVEDYFQYHQAIEQEVQCVKDIVNTQIIHSHIPSILTALSISMEKQQPQQVYF